jgi:hypothetical protein
MQLCKFRKTCGLKSAPPCLESTLHWCVQSPRTGGYISQPPGCRFRTRPESKFREHRCVYSVAINDYSPQPPWIQFASTSWYSPYLGGFSSNRSVLTVHPGGKRNLFYIPISYQIQSCVSGYAYKSKTYSLKPQHA